MHDARPIILSNKKSKAGAGAGPRDKRSATADSTADTQRHQGGRALKRTRIVLVNPAASVPTPATGGTAQGSSKDDTSVESTTISGPTDTVTGATADTGRSASHGSADATSDVTRDDIVTILPPGKELPASLLDLQDLFCALATFILFFGSRQHGVCTFAACKNALKDRPATS